MNCLEIWPPTLAIDVNGCKFNTFLKSKISSAAFSRGAFALQCNKLHEQTASHVEKIKCSFS